MGQARARMLKAGIDLRREHDVQAEIMAYLKGFAPDAWFWVNKTGGIRRRRFTTYNGAADILGCYRGLHIEFEVKQPKGTQSEDQIEHEKHILEAGGRYYVVRSVEDVQRAMEAL